MQQMSKAANHQAIKRDDFLKMATNDGKVNGFQVPLPPSLVDANDDDDEIDESAKLQPLNISILKEIIHKKVQKMTIGSTNIKDIKKLDKFSVPSITSQSGLRSRQMSNASIKSSESSKNHDH